MGFVLKWLESLILYVAMSLVIILLGLIFFQIVARNLLGTSFIFIEELSLFLLSWCAFLSAAYTYRKKGHVAVEYFYDKLSEVVRRGVNIITLASIFLFSAYTVYFGWGLATRQMFIRTPVMQIPRGWLFFSVPVSFAIICVFIIEDFWQLLVKKQPVFDGFEEMTLLDERLQGGTQR